MTEPATPQDTIVVDLDGTLALMEHRLHHINGEEPADWDAFFEACDGDEPNWPIIELVRGLADAYSIVVCSGRNAQVVEKTKDWLAKHRVPYDQLIMRPPEERRPDHALKGMWVQAGYIAFDRIAFVLEDRSSVVAMWRSLGLTCLQVREGDF